jgi:RNA polymerase sigma factor (sigma-70 family)
MRKPCLDPVVRQLQRLAARANCEELSDSALLERFIRMRDADAFAALVARHGPLVWRVCRRVLRCNDRAEDCVQATFLVLVRRARSIRKPASLASWLHGVAFRIARAELRRMKCQEVGPSEEAPSPEPDPSHHAAWRELGRMVEEEVHALPEALRQPVLACYWQGLTNEEAARQLGWPAGTVKTRLARARAILHERLTTRGVTLPAGVLAIMLAASPAEALLPARLMAAALHAAQAPGECTSTAVALANGLLRTAPLAKAKLALALGLAAALVLLGVGSQAGLQRPDAPDGEVRTPMDEGAPAVGQATRTDALGDPLPPDALMRLGTIRFRQGGRVNSVALSHDGHRIASAGWDDTVRVWEAATGKELRVLGPHDRAAVSVAFAPDGKHIATGTWFGSTYIWDAATGKLLHTLPGSPGGVTAVAFAPDGKTLAVGGSVADSVRLFDMANAKEVHHLSGGGLPLSSMNTPDSSVAFSQKGDLLAAAHGNVIRLWNAGTGKLVRRFAGHTERVFAVVFLPHRRQLASAAGDGTVRLWDVDSGAELRRMTAAQRNWRVQTLAASDDGSVLISGSDDNNLSIWDTATGSALYQSAGDKSWMNRRVFSVALSKGQLAAGYSNGLVRVWKLPEIDKLRRPTSATPPGGWQDDVLAKVDGHCEGLSAVSVSPDNKFAATASSDRTVRVWDLATGKEHRRFDGDSAIFSRDGRWLVTSGRDGPICIRDWPEGQELHRIDGAGPALSPDSKYLACVKPAAGKAWGSDYWDVLIYELAGVSEVRCLRSHPGGIHCLAFSPDGTLLASGAGAQRQEGPNVDQAARVVDTIRLWDIATGKVVHQFGGDKDSIFGLAFSPDGRSLASAAFTTGAYKKGAPPEEHDAPVRIWEVTTGRERARLRGHQGWATSVAFAPDGRSVAAGGVDHTVRLWDALSGAELRCWADHRDMVTVVAFTPDGKALISGSSDTTGLVWAVPPRKPTARKPLSAAEQEARWLDLGSSDAAYAYAAIAALVADVEGTLPLLRRRLRPVAVPGKEIAHVIDALGEDDFDRRARATKVLQDMGEGAGSALRDALGRQSSLEARRRVERLVADADVAALRGTRAIEVLELLACPDTRPLLESLTKGMSQARLTREAQRALRRIDRQDR